MMPWFLPCQMTAECCARVDITARMRSMLA